MVQLQLDADTLKAYKARLGQREADIRKEARKQANAFIGDRTRRGLQPTPRDADTVLRHSPDHLKDLVFAQIDALSEVLSWKGDYIDEAAGEALFSGIKATIYRWAENPPDVTHRDESHLRNARMRRKSAADHVLQEVKWKLEVLVGEGKLRRLAPVSAASEAPPPFEVMAYLTMRRVELALRKLIQDVLFVACGAEWETQRVPRDVLENWRKLRADVSSYPYPWAVPVESNLELANFDDYKKIIVRKDNWSHFRSIFRNQRQTEAVLEELNALRNVVAHMRVLTEVAFARLKSQAEHVVGLIGQAGMAESESAPPPSP